MMRHTLVLFLLCAVFSCKTQQVPNSDETPANREMTNFSDYSEHWEEVAELEEQGKPRSARERVATIYQLAKEEKNAPQIYKALVHRSKYILTLEEDAELTIINDFREEITKASSPEKQILQSALAELYWQYFQSHRYQFLNRTATETPADSVDFRTWDLQRLFDRASDLYDKSLQNADKTQQYPLGLFNEILISHRKQDSLLTGDLQPTLYDLLIHRAIQFYSNDQSGLTEPAYKFVVRDEEAFAPLNLFLNYQPDTRDSTSNKLKTIHLYQKLLAFHKQNNRTDALIYFDVERLKYVHRIARHPQKDVLYEEALKKLLVAYTTNQMVSLAGYELAHLYYQQGADYETTSADTGSPTQWKWKEAVEQCNRIIAGYPESPGAQRCKHLKEAIQQPSLSMQAEKYITPDQPFRFLVNYQNVDTIWFYAAGITDSEEKEIQNLYREERIKYLAGKNKLADWHRKTPDVGDFRQHSYEEPFYLGKTLNAGDKTLIIASADAELTKDSKIVGHAIVQPTTISYSSQQTDEGYTFYVNHRSTGEPIPGATLSFALQSGGSQYKINQKLTTDKNGEAHLRLTGNGSFSRHSVIIRGNNEKVEFDPLYLSRRGTSTNNWQEDAFLFTDRSIYRPGQSVHFKAISLRTNGEETEVQTNQNATVVFYDANGEKIEEINVKTNEFGSASGSFTIPRGRLLGNYRIQFNNASSTGISVEEYKRPTFQVNIDSLQGNYHLGDEITARGKAASYAGSAISNAQVQYRVTRKVRFPYFFSWYRPVPQGSTMEVAFGETTTDRQGNFEIPFTAIPDESIDKESMPVFIYEIHADVTDISGETRSRQLSVEVGYTALELLINTKQHWQADEKNTIILRSQNLNHQPVEASGEIVIHKLQAPDRVLTDRSWNVPDQQILAKSEWVELFPHQAYNEEESTPSAWKEGKQVFSSAFHTGKKGKEIIEPSVPNWAPGWYKVSVQSEDAFGNNIEQETLVFLHDQKSDIIPDNELLTVQLDKEQYEPGDTAILTIGTAASDLSLLLQIGRGRTVIRQEFLQLDNEKQVFEIPVTQQDRGGLAVSVNAAKWNSFAQKSSVIQVPWSDKELNVSVSTFRDKLKPGSEETWSFTVKGAKGEQVSAELLAGMYDASLDQFKPHSWSVNIPRRSQYNAWLNMNTSAFGSSYFQFDYLLNRTSGRLSSLQLAQLNFFGFNLGYGPRQVMYALDGRAAGVSMEENMRMRGDASVPPPPPGAKEAVEMDAPMEMTEEQYEDATDEENESLTVQPRKNLQETAFFFPDLTTDEHGNVTFSFTTPEALTEWKVLAFAHTKDLKTGMWQGSTVTQKELMVTPNAPRFFRIGDEISFTTKISNLTDQPMEGRAELQLLNAITLQPVYDQFSAEQPIKQFQVDGEGNTSVSWQLAVPEDVPAITYRVLAETDNFADGEENALPVLSNRMLVTETLPMPLRSNETKTFTLDHLKNNTSNTLKNHQLTLEMTSNPAWYAVQALPYLMEYPYECAEQVFSRYYANSLATHIASSDPKIKAVFDAWRNYQPDALKSNLEKNEELKSLILRETPWVRDAESEAEQKRRIGLLFDVNKMAQEQQTAISQLQQLQYENGGWPWFAGGDANRFITQHIVAGLGHLDKLNVQSVRNNEKTWQMTKEAIQFVDNQLRKDFEDLKRNNKNWQNTEHRSNIHTHYFYTRSFFQDVPVSEENKEAFDFYFSVMKKDWLREQLYQDGLAAMAFHRYGENKLAEQLTTSLDERSITDEEMGMYWKNNQPSWWWYQAPIETQALMIEVFDEVANDQDAVDELKIWLLKQKQTNSWKTTKATAEAVYALLLRGGNWLAVDDLVDIELGGEPVDPKEMEDVEVEAGTGYFKTSWNSGEIDKDMATVTATRQGTGIAWGALYWQYFEDLDKISTFEETPLTLNKQLFLQKNTATGPKLSAVNDGQQLTLGDLVKVRIELRVDRDMEFVHMKDMRAAGFEPTNVLSRYKWQDGLGYYESTKDASTDFFFDYLPKGVYVFEYPLRVSNQGNFSNGITTIQSMYAPEFTSHSEGVRVVVE